MSTPEGGTQPKGFKGRSSDKRQFVSGPPAEAHAYQDGKYNDPSGNIDSNDTDSGFGVTYQSAAWWNEQRIKHNPGRKGETPK